MLKLLLDWQIYCCWLPNLFLWLSIYIRKVWAQPNKKWPYQNEIRTRKDFPDRWQIPKISYKISIFKCNVSSCWLLFFYKNDFIRKALILARKLRTSWEQSQTCCPTEYKNKVCRLVILKIIRTKHQNRAWLSVILHCI